MFLPILQSVQYLCPQHSVVWQQGLGHLCHLVLLGHLCQLVHLCHLGHLGQAKQVQDLPPAMSSLRPAQTVVAGQVRCASHG